jgi:CheY-like chemotaxis protein
MTPEQQRRAFEAFVQFDIPGRRGEVRGLGLGLAIVQHGVRLLDHRLTLRSERGRGSCFTLTLPAERRHADRDAAKPAAAGFPVGRRIVLVEDDPELRDALLARLRAWSMQVRSFDGLQPLAAAMAAGSLAEADLLVTDMRLPDGDGLAVIDCVRQRWPAMRSLVITGNTLPAELVRLERSGVPVLHKPFRAEALLAMLGEPVPDDSTGVATGT